MAAVDADSLSFCFEAVLKDTEWESLQLDIRVCPQRRTCNACGNEFAVVEYNTICPACAGSNSTPAAGTNWISITWRWRPMERLPLKSKVLNENQIIAESLRERYREHGVLCLNLISGPGSGKTALLERTLASFDRATRVCVLTGDIQTDNDARRLAQYGFPVQQITTGGTCHLDGRMIERHLAAWNLDDIDLLFIETSATWSARQATTSAKPRRLCCSA